MDIGSHRINLFLDLFGEVRDVQGYCDTLAGPYPAEDCASLLVRFDSGAHGTLQCCFSTPANLDEFLIVGTRGRVHDVDPKLIHRTRNWLVDQQQAEPGMIRDGLAQVAGACTGFIAPKPDNY
jgi:predicted dehydrogenase